MINSPVGKVLPGPCTLAEEARAAVDHIEGQFPAEAGLIERLAARVAVLQKVVDRMESAADDFASDMRVIRMEAE